jgi:hypothetical protein
MQEAYADLYENLVLYNSDFQEHYRIMITQTEMENCRLEELYQIRLLAAKMIYLNEYYLNDNEKYLRTLYQEIMQNSLLININSSIYANDTVTGFTNIKSFIGKIIAAKIQSYLEESFDQEWYRRNTASEALKKLFSYGGLVTPDNYEKILTS